MGVFWGSQNSKTSECQDLPKFELGWGVEYSGVVKTLKTSKCQGLPKFEFLWGMGVSGVVKTQKSLSAKIYLNLDHTY